jgi:hypothetical protein
LRCSPSKVYIFGWGDGIDDRLTGLRSVCPVHGEIYHQTTKNTKNRKFHHGWTRINTDKKWNTERGDTNFTNFHEREEFAQAAETIMDSSTDRHGF